MIPIAPSLVCASVQAVRLSKYSDGFRIGRVHSEVNPCPFFCQNERGPFKSRPRRVNVVDELCLYPSARLITVQRGGNAGGMRLTLLVPSEIDALILMTLFGLPNFSAYPFSNSDVNHARYRHFLVTVRFASPPSIFDTSSRWEPDTGGTIVADCGVVRERLSGFYVRRVR